jgi:hypothetical protein
MRRRMLERKRFEPATIPTWRSRSIPRSSRRRSIVWLDDPPGAESAARPRPAQSPRGLARAPRPLHAPRAGRRNATPRPGSRRADHSPRGRHRAGGVWNAGDSGPRPPAAARRRSRYDQAVDRFTRRRSSPGEIRLGLDPPVRTQARICSSTRDGAVEPASARCAPRAVGAQPPSAASRCRSRPGLGGTPLVGAVLGRGRGGWHRFRPVAPMISSP